VNQEDFEQRLDDMLYGFNRRVRDRAIRLWNSGGISQDNWDEVPYLPVQVCLIVAIDDEKPTMRCSPNGKELVRNLRHF